MPSTWPLRGERFLKENNAEANQTAWNVNMEGLPLFLLKGLTPLSLLPTHQELSAVLSFWLDKAQTIQHRQLPMHSAIKERFPKLAMLWERSDKSSPDNYFGIYTSPTLHIRTEIQFLTWEALIQSIDPKSLDIFLRKAAGRVSACSNPERGWSQLVESMNEVRAYRYAQALGYTTVRFLDEQAHPLPDIEASNPTERCLIEVKTIQESDDALKLGGQVQSSASELPIRLKRVIKKRFSHATTQIAGHPWAATARKICYMIINLDLRTLLAEENNILLRTFVEGLEADVEIHCISQHWPARSNAAEQDRQTISQPSTDLE
jgi:hypothetical protein